MNIIKLTPLGTLSILLAVECWNSHSDDKLRRDIKKNLLSGDTTLLERGVEDLEHLVHGDLWNCQRIGPDEVDSLKHHFTANGGNCEVKKKKARAETAFYFSEMFKAGHFKPLPMPEFSYDSEPELIVERRVLDDRGRASIKGPCGH
jgi:hypothetical protein